MIGVHPMAIKSLAKRAIANKASGQTPQNTTEKLPRRTEVVVLATDALLVAEGVK